MAWRRYQSTRYLLENTIYHCPPKHMRINSTFLDLAQDNILEQVVTCPTRKEHTLDLFLSNRPSLVNRCEPLPGIGDHDIVYIDSDITAKINKPVRRKIFIWKKSNTTDQADKARNMRMLTFIRNLTWIAQ